MLESRGKLTNRFGNLRVDGVLLTTRRRGVMGFVENEKRSATEVAQPIAKRRCVRFVNQQPLGNEESRMRAPRIDTESPLAANSLHVFLVEYLKRQPKAGFQFILPLQQHGRRASDDNLAGLLS